MISHVAFLYANTSRQEKKFKVNRKHTVISNMKKEGKRLFVTIGTTKFNKLIHTVSRNDILELLHELGYTVIQFQTGQGKFILKSHPKINLLYNSYFENFADEISKSDLVISHAGAGTCLDVLWKRKPLIVVVNEDLMDNHQAELAEQLEASGYVYHCTVNNLKEVLKKDLSYLKPYPITDVNLFPNYLNKCVGFVKY